MIRYHDPVAPTQVEVTPYRHSLRIRGANDVHIGFLANGFPDSENFLNELQDAITEIEPGVTAHAYNKGNASIAAPDDLLDEIMGDCQAVVAAYGH